MSHGLALYLADGRLMLSMDTEGSVFIVLETFALDFGSAITKDYTGQVIPGSTLSAMEVGAGGYHDISISGAILTAAVGSGSGVGHIVVGYR